MKKIIIFLFFITAGLSAETIEVNRARLEKAKYFNVYASYDSGVTGEIFLNGLFLGKIRKNGGTLSSNMPQYLSRKGINTMEVRFDEGGKGSFQLKFFALAEPGFPDDDSIIFQKEIPFPSNSASFELTFDLGEAPPATIFNKAEKIENLTDDDRKAIYSAFQMIQKNFKAKDKKAILELLDFLISEKAAVSYTEKAEVKKSFEEMLNTPDILSAELAPYDQCIFTLKNNLVFISAAGKAPLILKMKQGNGEIRYTFARINGRWLPVI